MQNAALPGILPSIDVCVALTRSDGGGGTSNAMLEQMAAGRVMLAWDNVIFRQWLHHENAFLAPQGDVDGLEACLAAISRDRAEALRRAGNGPVSVADHGVDTMMRKFDETVRSALGRRQPDPSALR